MTDIEVDAYTPLDVIRANCHPQLLKQLERQADAARRPRIVSGYEVAADGTTVIVYPGVMLAVGRYLAATKPASFTLSTRPGQYRVDTIVLTDHPTGPTVDMVMGEPGYLIDPAPPRNARCLAWVLVRGYTNTVYTDRASLDAERDRIRATERDRYKRGRRRERQRRLACSHSDLVEDSAYGDPHRSFRCTDCGHTEKRPWPVQQMAVEPHSSDLWKWYEGATQ